MWIVLLNPDLTDLIPDPTYVPHNKGNISARQLAIVTNKVGRSVKPQTLENNSMVKLKSERTSFATIWYRPTIHLVSKQIQKYMVSKIFQAF